MTVQSTTDIKGLVLKDSGPSRGDLVAEVVAGLARSPKEISCKYFYDQRGSKLFEKICGLEEYYLTRTELKIMRDHAGKMSRKIGPGCLLVELGSGSSLKTRILLDHLVDIAGYVPIDISRTHLMDSVRRLVTDYPQLNVIPVCADYLRRFELPVPARPRARTVVYFPGSTIGNFHAADARGFLGRIARMCGPGGGLLIGVDLIKSPDVLLRAYDDAAGVTAAFNLNLLRRINHDAGADFDLGGYQHRAVWDGVASRIEMHLVSQRDQTVTISGTRFDIGAGEPIRTECCCKYTLESFAALAEGFAVDTVWTDADNLFSVQYLRSCG